jgi:hypothetical protein
VAAANKWLKGVEERIWADLERDEIVADRLEQFTFNVKEVERIQRLGFYNARTYFDVCPDLMNVCIVFLI